MNLEQIAQLGMGVLALILMYRIAANDLKSIQQTLNEIKKILMERL